MESGKYFKNKALGKSEIWKEAHYDPAHKRIVFGKRIVEL